MMIQKQNTFPFLKENSLKNLMLCLHNALEIFRRFSWLYYLYLKIQNWHVFAIQEKVLVYKLVTFKDCKEVKHMIMIISIIYIFFYLMWYLINSRKLLSEWENPQMMSVNLSDIAILNIKGSNCCIINAISRSKSINVMQNTYLTKKKQNTIKHKNLLPCIKMGRQNFNVWGYWNWKKKFLPQ